MSATTDKLIADLALKGERVRRLRPPMVRALTWLALIAVLALACILAFSNLPVFARRASDPRMAVELAATLATGLAGVIAAFHLSVPDRSRAWAWLPAPFAFLWMSLSGWGCYADWAEQNARGWALGQSSHCFFFVLAVGVAGLSAFILQFFHPFDVTLLDLGAHLTGVLVIIAAMTLVARPAIGRG